MERPVIGLPHTFTAREALDSAVSAAGGSFTHFLEAGNGTIAQALAAAGRGVAVVSDDARFGLVPVAIQASDRVLAVHLVAACDARGITVGYLVKLADRLNTWTAEQYQLIGT